MTRRLRSITCAWLLLLTALAWPLGDARAAGDAAGTAAASFLSVGNGASVLSMGGATLASGGDLASAAWNPASLARLDGLQFSFTHAPLPGGASQEWLATGGRIGGSETRWGFQTLFQRESGIEGRDAANNPTGSLSASDLALGLRVAHRFAQRVDVGVGGEWVHESLADVSGSGFAFDAGARAEAGAFGFGVAARHIGGGMSWDGVRYDLPAVIAGGVSWTDASRGLRVNADLESPSHYFQTLRVGGEWMWRGQVALRAGYRSELGSTSSERLSGPAFGLGTGVGTMWMDYGFTLNGADGAGQHRVGLTFRPGAWFGGAAAAQPVAAPREPKPARVKVAREPRSPAKAAKSEQAAKGEPAEKPAAMAPEAPPVVTPAPMPVMPPAPAVMEPVPPPAPPAPAPAAPASVQRPAVVVLAPGETLADLARRWETSVPAIMMVNNLVSERVQPGTKLKLPPPNRR